MKYLITLLLVISFFHFYSFSQSKYGDQQIIESSNGDSLLSFRVIDFDTAEPLIGVSIYSVINKTKIGETDINGLFACNKIFENRFRFSYVGYEGICCKIIDSTTSNIIVRMISNTSPICIFNIIEQGYHSDNIDSDLKNGALDANNDIEHNTLQLFYREELTEEQLEFANNYGFKFVDGKDKTREYTFSYNRVILIFLSNKHQIIIEHRLRNICWFNK
jgi:hypothetical protein